MPLTSSPLCLFSFEAAQEMALVRTSLCLMYFVHHEENLACKLERETVIEPETSSVGSWPNRQT
jgi:hypothetical protein